MEEKNVYRRILDCAIRDALTQVLRESEPLTFRGLCDLSGLSQPTVRRRVRELIDSGVVKAKTAGVTKLFYLADSGGGEK